MDRASAGAGLGVWGGARERAWVTAVPEPRCERRVRSEGRASRRHWASSEHRMAVPVPLRAQAPGSAPRAVANLLFLSFLGDGVKMVHRGGEEAIQLTFLQNRANGLWSVDSIHSSCVTRFCL